MKLRAARKISELSEVCAIPDNTNEEILYWVYQDIDLSKRFENMTIISPQRVGNEFAKTYGHYHATNTPETYKLLSGTGVLLLQKKETDPDVCKQILFVQVQQGEEVVITQEWGHAWINLGNTPLVSIDDWRDGHTPHDYEPVKIKKGFAFYVLEKNGELSFVPNNNYKIECTPKIVTLQEFNSLK